MREVLTDLWRIFKLVAGICIGPLLIWGALVLLGVLK